MVWSRFNDVPPQVQVGTDGQESVVTKLNDAPALRLSSAPTGKTYYKVGGVFHGGLPTHLD